MSHYIIQNPYHDYAVEIMKRIRARFGHTPVCLFTDPRRRYYHERRYPALAELAPDTRIDARLEDMPELAASLRERFGPCAGLVAFSEESLKDAALLLKAFGIDWNTPEAMARVRDKDALKSHLSRARPDLRLNRHFPVRAPADLDVDLPERFVLKPNDGAGSRGVGVFRRETPKAELARFLAGQPGQVFILEEFLSGDLYSIDGLVDERGKARVAGAFASPRRSANGSDVVYGDGWLIHQDTALFRDLESYAVSVMEASGLRRCPFHMEVIVDGRGPCLVEVGARLVGSGVAFDYALAHGGRFDFFAAAAHGYLSEQPYGEPGFDWDRYNSIQIMDVNGVSTQAGIVVRADGVEEVERMPEFSRWFVKPSAGQALAPTTDLDSIPWSAILHGSGSLEELRAAAERVRGAIRLEVGRTPAERLKAWLGRKVERAPLRLGWIARAALLRLRQRPKPRRTDSPGSSSRM